MTTQKALSGIKVFDATQGVAGPHATMLLALHGANVIKVEPLQGDWCRVLGKAVGQHCAHSLAFNRGKRSIAFDMKTGEGREIARRLLADADVFVESFRPGVVEKLGLGYQELRRQRPKIVYASISGFGQTGLYSPRPVTDGLIQAFSGMMVMNKTSDGLPNKQGMIIVDVVTGLYAFQAICPAIMRQLRFGAGSYIDANMMQSTAALQAAKVMEYHHEDGQPAPMYVPAGMFRTADGYIVISGMRDSHFCALCGAIERPDMASDPRWATQTLRITNGAPMLVELRQEFVKRNTDDWLERLHAVGVLSERVRSYGEWLEDDHVKQTNSYGWCDYGAFGRLPVVNIPGVTPIQEDPASMRVPNIGEDSRAILNEHRFSSDEIDRLINKGVVRESAAG